MITTKNNTLNLDSEYAIVDPKIIEGLMFDHSRENPESEIYARAKEWCRERLAQGANDGNILQL